MPAEQPASAPAQSWRRCSANYSRRAKQAASSLSKAVSVGFRFTDVPGEFRFHAVDGKPRFEPGKADEPDFKLTLFPGAVHDVCGKSSADVGDLTVLFLQHIFANEPDQRSS